MLRNSTRQPIDELAGGGLNLRVCQLVDWIFCATKLGFIVDLNQDVTDLKMITAIRIVLVDCFGKYHKRVTNE
jgi:hypothetical protein